MCFVERLDVLEDGRDRFRERQVRAGDTPQHNEAHKPEPECAVQAPDESLRARSCVNRHAAAPVPDARPPDGGAGDAEHQHEDSADAVDTAAGFSRKQVVMQVKQRDGEPESRRYRVTEILTRKRIEQPPDRLVATLERHLDRLIDLFSALDAGDVVTGIRLSRGSG
jgi:hypothetical protein